MNSPRLRRLILAATLAILPLQGIAAGMMAMPPCHGDDALHAMDDGPHAHDHGSAPAGHRGDSESDAGIDHPCCQSTATAPSTVTLPAAPADSPVRTLAADAPRVLFVPEQPQRPPLA